MKKFIVPYYYIILSSMLLFSSEFALGAPELTKFKLVKCTSSFNLKVGRVCTIEMSGRFQRLKKGTPITAYTSRGYWKSLGYVYAQKGSKMVVIFHNLSTGLARNSKFKIYREYESFDWASAFSKSDF
ncbi:MAG: hypothetical protein HRU09_20385 [Oligoflexales bacterium]|nr:hypothetical protein [Oligoflexales bacterium]